MAVADMTLAAGRAEEPGFGAALKDAALAALITFGLLVLIVGFETRQTLDRPLAIFPRAQLLGICIALVFGGRLVLSLSGAKSSLATRVTLPILLAVVGGLLAAPWGLGAQIAKAAASPLMGEVAKGVAGIGFGLLGGAALAVLRELLGAVGALFRATVPRRGAGVPRSKFLLEIEKRAGPAFLGISLVFPLTVILLSGGLQPSRYWVDVGILLLTYIMLGWGLNIVVGLAGLLDLGYVAFYAVGAYSYALIATSVVKLPGWEWMDPWLFWVCLPISGLLAALWGVLLGFPVLRLRGDYLAIVTLAFGEIIKLVLINWEHVTGGGAGISSIPRPTFFGIPFSADDNGFAALFGFEFDPMHRVLFLYYLILVLAAVTYVAAVRLRKLPIGRAWEALREDEIACRSLGIDTVNTKLTAFAIGAMFGGFAGCFFAARQGFISPESFTFMESAIILAIVVLGGMGSMLGVVVATLVLIGGPELLRNVDFLKAVFGADFDPTQYRMLLLGLGMVLIMIWRPRGLISTREPTAFLLERKRVSGDLVKEGHG